MHQGGGVEWLLCYQNVCYTYFWQRLHTCDNELEKAAKDKVQVKLYENNICHVATICQCESNNNNKANNLVLG